MDKKFGYAGGRISSKMDNIRSKELFVDKDMILT